MIDNCSFKEPFVIGLFYGTAKPCNHEFLLDFINDVHSIEEGFAYEGKQMTVKISAFICDAPARAFIKNVKGHAGCSGCEKCIQHGVWLDKITFPETNASLRTHASFIAKDDEDHHLGETPLTDLSIGMVSAFPLDYMHLVCLGVMRRLLKIWTKGPLRTRLGPRVVKEISNRLEALRPSVPLEFARKPRPLREVDRWKASEFRQFLLYSRPLVLLGKLPDEQYKNFLLFSVSLHILLHPILSTSYCDYAQELLVLFVNHYGQLYGRDMITYNVHGLVHLPNDVKKFGVLDSISCFPFENYLGHLKRMVRKPSSPLQQVIRRMTSYAVVVFTGEEGVAMIPEVWCVGDNRCYWPPFKTVQRFERALLSCEPPKENWALYDMQIL
ncbi:hypothetical protein HOLleu_43677 [Holothuria leucospilota]|uniref:Transposase domain-containing protein n=1 Tax=Holothuria leucospilota TaxID=206669 RepID=A0A9Q1B9M2_HOLLE|nr:hypothetical protein HOLleu_43677 [Holothuria leucospilota]